MSDAPDQLIGWVSRNVLPHERQLRAWLLRAFPAIEVDDVIQEAYCRLTGLSSTAHIKDPRQYFFRTARNIVYEQVRRNRIVSIEYASGLAVLDREMAEEPASPEQIVADRRALARVEQLIGMLPDRARQIFQMRKIEGLPQREIAAKLGCSETIVENEVSRGLRRILHAMTCEERDEMPTGRRRTAAPLPSRRHEP